MDLKKEIEDAIEKDLPNQVGKALKKRLADAELIEEKLKISEERLSTALSTIESQKATIRDFSEMKLTQQGLDDRAKNLDKKENELELEALKVRLECEKEKSKFGFETALGLVRNSEFRRTVFTNSHLPDLPGRNQDYNTPQNSSSTITETEQKT